ncbi:hypothetical protein F4818DRAFT_420625 [Hypoxylon cercidicola]|nr:hypothetical protein F4818DRAFT_420625 [Hypoxylon cercidicola]
MPITLPFLLDLSTLFPFSPTPHSTSTSTPLVFLRLALILGLPSRSLPVLAYGALDTLHRLEPDLLEVQGLLVAPGYLGGLSCLGLGCHLGRRAGGVQSFGPGGLGIVVPAAFGRDGLRLAGGLVVGGGVGGYHPVYVVGAWRGLWCEDVAGGKTC